MRRYSNSISGITTGLPVYQAQIRVLKSDASAAQLYSDNGITTLSQPVLTDGSGFFSFFVADGTYTLVVADPDGSNPRSFPTTEIYEDARNVSVPVGEPGLTLPSAASRAGKVQTYDGSGNPTVTAKADIGGTGPANVLSVGTVTKIAAGGTPTASITGTSPAQTLNVGLVTGDKGDAGDPGPAGSVTGVDALGTVVSIMPPATSAGVFASFNTNTTGNYFYQGRGDTTISDWLAIATGTFTRSGTATYVTSAGLTAQAGSGVPRFTYDPVTLAPLGLLYEPAATNLWPYSNKGNALGASAWQFSSGTVVMTDNAATGADGTASAFTLLEAAGTGTHSAFYYPGAGVFTVPGHFYAVQFLVKPHGRTKVAIDADNASGMPSTVVDLTAVTATNGYTVQVWNSGYYLVSTRFTGAGAGADVVYFIFALHDNSGASSYAGDVAKGIDVDNVMFSEIASLTAPLPSMVYRPDATAATRNADLLTITLPTGTTRATYTFSDGTQQIVTVAAGSYNFPTTLTGGIIRSFISADLGVVGTLVTSVFGRTGAVTGAQADIAGLTTASSPSFTGLAVSGGGATVASAVLRAISTDYRFAAGGTALTAIRGILLGANPAQNATNFQNSVIMGHDAAKTATIIGTAVVIGDTAAGVCTSFQNSNAIGNEAANCSGAVVQSEIMGNVALKGAATATNSQVIGQAGSQYNNVSSSVLIGFQAGVGSAGNVGTHSQSVIIGASAGSSLLGAAATYTGNILIGYNVQPPTATTSNYMTFGDVLTYLGSTSTMTLRTPANGKAKLVLKGLAASTSYANDAAAAAGGVGIDEIYRNGSIVMVRVA